MNDNNVVQTFVDHICVFLLISAAATALPSGQLIYPPKLAIAGIISICEMRMFSSLSLSLSLSGSLSLSSIRVAITEVIHEEMRELKESQQELKESQQELKDTQRETRAAVAQLQAAQVLSSPSRAELGRSLWEACQTRTQVIAETIRINSPAPFLTQVEHVELKAKYSANKGSKENVWVALLTPRLMELVAGFSPSKVLINSELIGWIRTEANLPNYFQKPDLFVCDPVGYIAAAWPHTTEKSSSSSQYAASLRTDAFMFGSCAWPLRDAVLCLLEAKVKIDLHEALGEVFSKMQNLLRGTLMASSKCCLFDMESMYLLTFTNTGLLSSQHFSLTGVGSFRAVAEFICPPNLVDPTWLRTVRQLCNAFKMDTVAGSAFLGSGAHGKVFRVRPLYSTAMTSPSVSPSVTTASALSSPDARPFALKIVDHRHQDSLDAEHMKLRRLLNKPHSILPTFVSPTVQRVFDPSSGSPLGSGLLMRPVGQWVGAERPSNVEKIFGEVLDTLLQLHLLDVTHGDARLENLIRVEEGNLVWIDFRESQIEASQQQERWWDLRTCLSNFSRHFQNNVTHETDFTDLQSLYESFHTSATLLSSLEWLSFKRTAWKKITPGAT